MWKDTKLEFVLSRAAFALLLTYPIIFVSIAYLTRLFAGGSGLPYFSDYGAYYHAAQRFLSGQELYVTSENIPQLASLPYSDMLYLYPPVFVVVFAPFGVLPFLPGALLWDGFSLAVLWVAVFALLRELGLTTDLKQRAIIALLVMGYAPTMWWLGEGQIAGLLTAGACFVALSLQRSSENRSVGIVTTLMIIIKPFYLPIQIFLLRNRDRLIAGIVTFVVVIGISLLFGISTVVDYVQLLSTGPGRDFLYVPPSEWTEVVFRPFAIFGAIEREVQILVVSILGLFVLREVVWNRRDYTDYKILSLTLLLITIVPGATAGTLTLLLPVFLYLTTASLQNGGPSPKLVLVSLLLIQIHPLTIRFLSQFAPRFVPDITDKLTPFIPILQPALWGVVLLFFLCFTHRFERRPARQGDSFTS